MKIDRLVSIIMVLLDRDRIGAQELADMFEVSKRSIYRDIDSINMAGIPVYSTSGVGGGFEILKSYRVDRKIFSASDLSTILMGLSGLSEMVRGDELVNALAKVKSFIPAEQAKAIELKTNRIRIDFNPWMMNKNIQPYLTILQTAMDESRLLSFGYVDTHGNITKRLAEPYQLVFKNSHWYWQGYCHLRNEFRLFKLSRTSDLKLLDERFEPREYEAPNLNIMDIVDSMKRVKLRIHRSVLERMLDYCPYEYFTPDGKDHYIVYLPFTENDYYYDVLLSLGDQCECLAPKHVRDEFKRRIGLMAAIYQ